MRTCALDEILALRSGGAAVVSPGPRSSAPAERLVDDVHEFFVKLAGVVLARHGKLEVEALSRVARA